VSKKRIRIYQQIIKKYDGHAKIKSRKQDYHLHATHGIDGHYFYLCHCHQQQLFQHGRMANLTDIEPGYISLYLDKIARH